MNVRSWTIEEDNYIKENFGYISFAKMSKKLGCAITTVQNRARFLGFEVEKKEHRKWTEEEKEFLKLVSSKYLNTTIAKRLKRPIYEVNKKARELGITLIFKKPIWKKWKEQFLKENLGKISLAKIMKELDVDYYQIIDKIEELDLEYKSNRWTKEEEEILRELASKYYIRSIAKVLNRSEGAVATKALKLGIEYITIERKYTEEELLYIKDNWGKIPVTDMARKLTVSRAMVQTQANLMNLPKLGNNPYQKWTDGKLEKLRQDAKTKTITELAKKYKTTNEAIQTVASRNCIDLIDEKIHWSDEDNCILRELAKTMTIQEIAIKMDRTSGAVRKQLERQNIEAIKNQEYEDSIWTDEDDKILLKLATENKTLLEICKLMNKKDQNVSKHAKMLNIEIIKEEYREWTEEEIEKLKKLSKTKKLSELVLELNRTASSIKSKSKKMNIPIIMDRKPWTKEDIETLKVYVTVDKKSPKEIAELMGRTEDSVSLKINRLGIKILSSNKRFWTQEEEENLSDLWGSIPIEKIAKKLERTVSSVRNKAIQLNLGSQIENNYDGIKFSALSSLFNIHPETIKIGWVALGLKYKIRYITKTSFYYYVEIVDLYEFLNNNQNIWDSRSLEKNILGIEPEWLKEKRKNDKDKPLGYFTIGKLTKQQLLLAKKFVSDQMQLEQETLSKLNEEDSHPNTDIKKLKKDRKDSHR